MREAMNRAVIIGVALTLGTVGAVACGSAQAQQACAATPPKPAPAKPASNPPPRQAAPKTPDPPAYKPPPPGAKAQPESKPAAPRSQSQTDRAKAEASKPKVKPAAEDAKEAIDTAPSRVTRGGSYHSSVTNNTYVFHDSGYYRRPGFIIDLFDPYDPYNYWSRPMSPFYQHPYVVAADCGGGDQKEVPPQNITVNVNDNGEVVGSTEPGTTPGSTP